MSYAKEFQIIYVDTLLLQKLTLLLLSVGCEFLSKSIIWKGEKRINLHEGT